MKIERTHEKGSPPSPTVVGPYFEQYGIVGRHPALADVIRSIDLVSTTRSTVLITGETGTGKELVARAVHTCGPRRHMPFVKVNCAAIPEALIESELFGYVRGAFTGASGPKRGKFSLANGGSILLDEIGTMSLGLQTKLLRVLQEREIEPLGSERSERVEVRVIAATNRHLKRLVEEGRFLDDLWYRLNVIPIVVPPLRERLTDVPMLAAFFADRHAARSGRPIEALDDDAMDVLMEHSWPGNIRELENTIERAVVLSTTATIRRDGFALQLAPAVSTMEVPSLKLHENLQWVERETIRRALAMTTKKRIAADLMGITPRALSHYLAKHPSIHRHPKGPGAS